MKYIKTFESKNIVDYIENDNIEKVKKIIHSGFNLNLQYDLGDTALIIASYHNRIEIAKLLINAGADVNIQNIDGDTALTEASSQMHIEIVKLLINAGAYLDIKNNNDITALIYATKAYGNNFEMCKLLIDAGADWNIKDAYNKDFLDWLRDKDKKRIIELYPDKYDEYLMKKNAEKYNL